MTKRSKDTIVTTAGRSPRDHFGAVNTPVYHASTITYPTLAEWEASRARRYDQVVYGRLGTPTTFAFERAMAALEGADRCVAVSSGMAACAATILACVKSGDHLLLPDTVYFPVRSLAQSMLKSFGVESEFYDPMLGAGIEQLIRPNTALIYLEAPGSQTFEVQDVPAITKVAKAKGILTALDNTWATPFFFRPLEHGVDFSINACTKYIVGHSDAMLGSVAMRQELFERVKVAANAIGNCPGSEELYLGLRGMRTLGVRLERHQKNALQVAHWFEQRPEVHKVLYPALPSCPGHEFWKRDFSGATGLLSVIFKPISKPQIAAFVDGLTHFGLGASFGGYESLVLPTFPEPTRTATKFVPAGPLIRFHIGLEEPADLIEDLSAGLARMTKTA